MADRVITTLACGDCKNKNYHFTHAKKKAYKVEIKKFCKACDKQTLHKESK